VLTDRQGAPPAAWSSNVLVPSASPCLARAAGQNASWAAVKTLAARARTSGVEPGSAPGCGKGSPGSGPAPGAGRRLPSAADAPPRCGSRRKRSARLLTVGPQAQVVVADMPPRHPTRRFGRRDMPSRNVQPTVAVLGQADLLHAASRGMVSYASDHLADAPRPVADGGGQPGGATAEPASQQRRSSTVIMARRAIVAVPAGYSGPMARRRRIPRMPPDHAGTQPAAVSQPRRRRRVRTAGRRRLEVSPSAVGEAAGRRPAGLAGWGGGWGVRRRGGRVIRPVPPGLPGRDDRRGEGGVRPDRPGRGARSRLLHR
jgi:hypothetical protein